MAGFYFFKKRAARKKQFNKKKIETELKLKFPDVFNREDDYVNMYKSFRVLKAKSLIKSYNVSEKAVEMAENSLKQNTIKMNFNYYDSSSDYHTIDLKFEKNVAILSKYSYGRNVRNMNVIEYYYLLDELNKNKPKHGV